VDLADTRVRRLRLGSLKHPLIKALMTVLEKHNPPE